MSPYLPVISNSDIMESHFIVQLVSLMTVIRFVASLSSRKVYSLIFFYIKTRKVKYDEAYANFKRGSKPCPGNSFKISIAVTKPTFGMPSV